VSATEGGKTERSVAGPETFDGRSGRLRPGAAHPLLGLRFLTFLLVAYLVCESLWKIIVSLRSMPAAGYLWLLASGILSLLVGLLKWQQWPLAGTSTVGILVGVNLVGTGIVLLAFAGSMKNTLRKAIFVLPKHD
jgi:uncharacterized membrane protein HdeD (DUF308 family)